MDSFNQAVNYVLRFEGELSENPKDPGGITKYGISLRFLKSIPPERLKSYGIFVAETINNEDIEHLTIDQAKTLYKGEFWDHLPLQRINNQSVINSLFDACINLGIAPAIKCMQRACWAVIKKKDIIVDDGILGEETIFKINNCGLMIIPAFIAERAGHYRLLVERNPNLQEFLEGWLRRSYGG